ncbi:hypothetical protein D3C75_732680 [compost metagenome]
MRDVALQLLNKIHARLVPDPFNRSVIHRIGKPADLLVEGLEAAYSRKLSCSQLIEAEFQDFLFAQLRQDIRNIIGEHFVWRDDQDILRG